jgi:hypothetical protein
VSSAVDIATQFRRDLTAADEALADEMAVRWASVEQALEAQIDALTLSIANAQLNGETVSESQLYQMDRYQQLLASLQVELERYQTYAERAIAAQQLEFAGLGVENATALLDAAGAVRGTFAVLGSAAFENVLGLARAGQPLAALLEAAYPAAAQGMTAQLLRGIALGVNPRQTARAMMQEGLTDGLQHVLLVSRDQSLRAWRTASLQQYQTSGVVRGYKRICAKQPGRTCLACIALDGTVYPTSEMMPLHAQDRCSMLPLLFGRDLPATLSGEAWFRQQPADVQAKMLGPSRYDLWERSAFQFQDLATISDGGVWGRSAQVTSLATLQQRSAA